MHLGKPGLFLVWISTGASAQLLSAQIDYPPAQLFAGIQGVTKYKVDLTPSGKVARCTIVESSGSPELDKATCAQLQRTASFNPATDERGEAVPSTYTGVLRWSIPGRH